MTSRDLTENVEQIQIFKSLEVIRTKVSAALIELAKKAEQWKDVYITARTHNVAAQTTTMGKRIAMFGEELLGAFNALEGTINNYPARGIKGAVGTQLDQLALFGDDPSKVSELENKISKHLGMPKTAQNVGQVYPRSLDLRVVSMLTEICSAPSSFCKTLRLMAGHELAGEGFAKGQVGSSAMPHKKNPRGPGNLVNYSRVIPRYAEVILDDMINSFERDQPRSDASIRDISITSESMIETAKKLFKELEVDKDQMLSLIHI